MLKDLPTLPYAIRQQLSTLAEPNSVPNVYDSPELGSARRTHLTLYWVFVGLFIISIGMFTFGVFAGNVPVGALGVIIVFLLYLFRRWFLPENPNDGK